MIRFFSRFLWIGSLRHLNYHICLIKNTQIRIRFPIKSGFESVFCFDLKKKAIVCFINQSYVILKVDHFNSNHKSDLRSSMRLHRSRSEFVNSPCSMISSTDKISTFGKCSEKCKIQTRNKRNRLKVAHISLLLSSLPFPYKFNEIFHLNLEKNYNLYQRRKYTDSQKKKKHCLGSLITYRNAEYSIGH